MQSSAPEWRSQTSGIYTMLRMNSSSVDADAAEMIYEVSEDMMAKGTKENGSCMAALQSVEGVLSVDIVRQDDEINQ